MADRFSIAAMCRAQVAGTWNKIPSTESRILETLRERYGTLDNGYDRVPDDALATRSTLTTLAPTGAGYLIDQPVVGYLAALQPASITLALGATPVMLERGGASIAHGVGGVQAYWQSDEVTPVAAGPPSFGTLPFVRRDLYAYCEISRQLLLQSNADQVVSEELNRAIGAELDKQILGGAGTGGTPLGLVNYPGIGTFTGTSLNYAALVAAMAQVSTANAVLNATRLGWAGTPAVAALLKQRYRVSGGELPLWAGQLVAGDIEAAPAYSSMDVPSATLIFGDWSQLLLAQWPDGLSIATDPFSNGKFQTAIIGVRACISIDVQLRTPAAFSVATGIT